MAHPRAGTPALPEDLIDVAAVERAYYDRVPDPDDPMQQVVFGTSGHRGSSLDGAFNEAHILATTQAIVEYRRSAGITGPLFIGFDTHALSIPAWRSALEVLTANEVTVYIAENEKFTPRHEYHLGGGAPGQRTARRQPLRRQPDSVRTRPQQ